MHLIGELKFDVKMDPLRDLLFELRPDDRINTNGSFSDIYSAYCEERKRTEYF